MSIRRMANDPDTKIRDTITLSYTFYPQREPQRPVADRSAGGRADELDGANA